MGITYRFVRPDFFEEPPAGGNELTWWSDWRNATGNTDAALLDGDKWTGYVSEPVRSLGGVIEADGLGFPAEMARVFRYEIPDANTAIQPRVNNQWTMPEVGGYQFYRYYIRCDFPPGHSPADQHFFHIGRDGGAYESTFWLNGVEGGSPPGSVGSGGQYRIQFMPNWQSATTTELAWQNIYLVTEQVYRIELRVHRISTTGIRFAFRVYDAAGNLRDSSPSQVWFEYYGSQGWTSLPDFELTVGSAASMLQTIEVGYNGSSPQGVFTPTPYVHLGGVAVRVTDDANAWIGAYPVEGVEDAA